MNDEVGSSSAAGAHLNAQHGRHAQSQATPTAAELVERQKKNRALFNRKRSTLLVHIIRDIDMLVYAELSAIYYMDCSFLRFALRAFVQFIYLTPKQPPFHEHPSERPMLGSLIGANLTCLLLHLWLTPPSAGETTRGYLHGGLAMDFIGQAGPSSRVYLLLLDFLVIILQLTHMSAYMLQRRLKDSAAGTATISAPVAETTRPIAASEQDLDAEERGVRRSVEQDSIEMQSLNPPANGTNPDTSTADNAAAESSDEQASSLAPTLAPQNADPRIVDDALYSGQIVVADLNIKQRIQDQIHLMKNYRADAQASSSGVNRLRMELAQRVLRMRMGADALREGI